jgi:glycosyltransferase involved in cell wall biosynthesis
MSLIQYPDRDDGVTVILPTYCRFRSGHLQRALQSYSRAVANVEFPVELLVYVDGSTDGSAQYLKDFSVYHLNVSVYFGSVNIGLPAKVTLNAIERAKYRYITWLLDDVEWDDQYLKHLYECITESDSEVCYGKVVSVQSELKSFVVGEAFDANILSTVKNIIPAGAVMLRSDVFDRHHWFDCSLLERRTCDHDLWIRLARDCSFYFVDKKLATEHGACLNNSLGHTSSFFPSVVDRWRSYRTSFVSEDLFNPDFFVHLGDKRLQIEYLTLVLEHFLNTGNFGEFESLLLTVRSSELGEYTNFFDSEKMSPTQGALTLLVFFYRSDMNRLRAVISEYRDAIDERQKYIDDFILRG